MGDPRGWEALTQQEAEQDARLRERDVALEARKLADQAVTEGVNLKYVERMRRGLYEAADALAVAVRERDQAQEALRQIESSLRPHRAASGEWADDAVVIAEVSVIVRAALVGGETVNQKPKGHTA